MSGYLFRRVGTLAAALLGLAAPCGAPALAQSPLLRGVVVEAATGAPVAGATVRALGGTARTTTDALGTFRLPFGDAGGMEVEVSAIGYAPLRAPYGTGAAAAVVEIRLHPAPLRMPEVSVIAPGAHGLARIPGSAALVTAEEMRSTMPVSGTEVLRRLTGLHVQEEEGFGMRANIGFRGLDPDRSRNVLVLEDGVPVALNPYGEPELYYTPPVDRMQRVEVVKGSGSILFGPQTIGGVINYVTPAPPPTPEGTMSVQGGEGGYLRAYGTYGGTWGRVGSHTGILHKRAQDVNGLFFDVTDVTGKLSLATGRGSDLGLKFSVYDELSNSTYVGLTEAMFAADPAQHPAKDDRLALRRFAGSVTHDLALSPSAMLRTTAYAYTTTRDWERQDYGYSADGSELVLRPTTGSRTRAFEVYGVEPRLRLSHAFLGVPGELDAGVRGQLEYATDVHVNGVLGTREGREVRDHELRRGRALSAFAQNRFLLTDRLTLTPGLRGEWFGYEREILRTRVRRIDPETGAAVRRIEDVNLPPEGDALFELIPGLGANWRPTDRVTVFAGAHRGFSPPRVKDAILYPDDTVQSDASPGELVSLALDAERSWNLEAGARTAPMAGVTAEATVFFLDFSNQIITPSASGGSASNAVRANQGETRHVGMESAVSVDFGALAGRAWALTGQVRHTWTDSRFSAERWIVRAPGDTVNVRGNRLPYAPGHMLALIVGFEHPAGVNVAVDGIVVGRQFADNFETVEASANGRNGVIPSYEVWNATAQYRLPFGGTTVFGSVKNLFDATYVASRRPEGIKPGLPRMLHVGVRAAF